jgi:hypothetical protein
VKLAACGPHAAHVDVLCGPTHFSDYALCEVPNVSALINFKFQMLVTCVPLFYISNKYIGNVFQIKFTFVCAYGKADERKIYLKLKLVMAPGTVAYF